MFEQQRQNFSWETKDEKKKSKQLNKGNEKEGSVESIRIKNINELEYKL